MQLPETIRKALDRGATIVAASPRAARSLHLSYAAEQHKLGREIWPTPSIFDWDTWLRDLWREYTFFHPEAPLLLTSLQERAIWKRMQGDDAALVVSPDSMAALAQEAWNLTSSYEAHRSRNAAWEQTDAEHFRRWAAAFDDECRLRNWISAANLEMRLTSALNTLPLPTEVVLAGFDRVTPAQRQFLNASIKYGIHVSEFAPEGAHARPQWIAAIDRRSELIACAQWARQLLQKDSQARLGVIVPDVARVREEMERIFRHILMPESEDILADSAIMPFEFSLGQPVAVIPVIRAALLLLRWTAGPLREEEVTWLMLSGFVADDAEFLPLARVDAELRNSGSPSPELSLEGYLRSVAPEKWPSLLHVHKRLGDLLQAAAANEVKQRERMPGAWTDLSQTLLRIASWPGPGSADSVRFQAQKRWERLLSEIALLDMDGARMRCDDFLNLLELHAMETIFAPESRDAPIQIMGPLESSGQQFDAVWFLGTDDNHWPMRSRPHPLLPPGIQRQYDMPHATPESDWQIAQTVTQRLLGSTQHIVFSYSQRDNDGDLRPSPVIAALFADAMHPETATELWPTEKELFVETLEEIADTPNMLPWPREQTAGGSEVLRSQAACPFQAFAINRLRAESLNTREWGLSAAERGNLLHEIMRRLWSGPAPQSLRSNDDLIAAIAENRLGEILDGHIAAVFAKLSRDSADDSWMQAYLASEQQRLRTRLEEWLQVEAHRRPFTVEACEQGLRNVHVGDLRLNLRADRIDLLPDGSRLLIDYKTGEVSAAAWKGERLEEPQLPLYAVYGNVEHVSGLLFAQIRAGKTHFQGRVRDALTQLDADLKASSGLVKEPYSEGMRDGWERALLNLAEDFLHGNAAVDPRDSKVCQYCPLPGVCRIAESQLDQSDQEEEERDDA
jgi:ATP-dependent helicase/nuclease subunit B